MGGQSCRYCRPIAFPAREQLPDALRAFAELTRTSQDAALVRLFEEVADEDSAPTSDER